MNRRHALTAAALLACLTACGTAQPDDSPPPEEERSATQEPAATREVTAEEVDPWPFTVEKGTLGCRGGKVTFATDGAEYGLTGDAQTDHPAPDPVWATDPESDGTRLSLGAAIEAGMALCE